MEVDFDAVKVVGFDADDTLWVNETYFRAAEEKFAELLKGYETKNKIDQELFKMEMKNLPFHTTWQHEEIEAPKEKKGYLTVHKLVDVLAYL